MSSFEVFWLLVGPRETASSRIHGYRIHDYLKTRGLHSEILSSPLHWSSDAPLRAEDLEECSFLSPGDVVVIQKLQGEHTQALVRALSSRGVNAVYVDSDLPLKLDEARACVAVVCSSEHLAQLYREHGLPNVHFIPDAYEVRRRPKIRLSTTGLHCVWFGGADPLRWFEVECLRTVLSASDLRHWQLITVSNHDGADIRWALPACWDHIHDADAVVVTGNDYPWSQVKSANRPVQAMALGVPPVVYPLPSYRSVIDHGHNGYLCGQPEEWRAALLALTDPEVRHKVAHNAFDYTSHNFSLEDVGERWLDLFTSLATASSLFRDRTSCNRAQSLGLARSRVYRRLGESLISCVRMHERYLSLEGESAVER